MKLNKNRIIMTILLLLVPVVALASSASGGPTPTGSSNCSSLCVPTQQDLQLNNSGIAKQQIVDFISGNASSLWHMPNSPLNSAVKAFDGATLILAGFMAIISMGLLVKDGVNQEEGMIRRHALQPIKMSFASASIMPVLGGFSLCQVVFLVFFVNGLGVANWVWSHWLETQSITASYPSLNNDYKIHNLAVNMLFSNICTITHNNDLKQIRKEGTNVINNPYGTFQTNKTPFGFDLRYGEKSHQYKSQPYYDQCGLIHFTTKTQSIYKKSKKSHKPLFTSSKSIDQIIKNVNKAVYTTQVNQGIKLNNKMYKLAKKVVNNKLETKKGHSLLNSKINQYVNQYAKKLKNTANNALHTQNNQSQYIKAMQKDGFLIGGAYYFAMGAILNKYTTALSNIPQVKKGINNLPSGGAKNNNSNKAVAFAKSLLYQQPSHTARMIKNSNVVQSQEPNSNGPEATIFTKLTRIIKHYMGQKHLFSKIRNEPNLMLVFISFGNEVQSIAQQMGLLGLGAGALSFIPFIGSAVKTDLAGPAISFANYFGMLGAGMSITTSLLPVVMWLSAVISLITFGLMGIFAIQLLCITYVASDPDGIIGRLGQLYMLLFRALTQASLLVIGLICAIVAMYPATQIFNLFFFKTASYIGITNPWAFFVWCLSWWGIGLAVIKQVFSLITYIPENIPQWLGGFGERLGGPAEKLQEQGMSNIQQQPTAGGLKNALATSGGGNNPLDKFRQGMENKINDRNNKGGESDSSVNLTSKKY